MMLIVLVPSVDSAQSCQQRAQVKERRALYDRPPSFDTGRGWRFGQVVHTVDRGDTIWICRKKTIGFGFSTQPWYQVGVFVNKNWLYGWIQGESVTPTRFDGVPRRSTPWFSASVAYAQIQKSEDGSGPPPLPPTDVVTKEALPDALLLFCHMPTQSRRSCPFPHKPVCTSLCLWP